MILNLKNLQLGLSWWRRKSQKEGAWPCDIHNADYYDIYGARAAGLTAEWWIATVDRLSQWHAYRGPCAPNTKVAILGRGKQVLNRIAADYEKLIKGLPQEPSIARLQWEDVYSFFLLASRIKPGSAVFAGKMCHFLFPKAFMVMDNLGTGIFDYEFYSRGMKDEWIRFKEKDKAEGILINAIRSPKALHPLYPMETKIIELCHIGYKHG
jgi:hypothetical protein